MAADLDRARTSFAEQRWSSAFDAFRAARGSSALDATDLERLAVSAYLVGEDDESAAAWQAAQAAALEADDVARSARCAFWLGFSLMLRGQGAQAGGWLARAERLMEEASVDCAAAGYLMIPGLLGALDGGDVETAQRLAVQAREIGDRFADADLRAFATLGHGQALIASQDLAAGTARLDEAMVSVTAGEVGPITAGIVFCAVILECVKLFDVQRAAEWTEALSSWCEAQPDLVPYRGQCLVHRSQLQQASGDWPHAASTAQTAWRQLTDPPHPALGMACYQRAELHRLVGALDDAEAEYREASRNGFEPIPGLALLEFVRGDTRGAANTLRRALRETVEPMARPALLAAGVDVFSADGDLSGARAAADELAQIAAGSPSAVLGAMADQATGTVLVAGGDAEAALGRLRAAATAWRSLGMPYETARAAFMVALACSALGDTITAALEFDNAEAVFNDLGAQPDLARLMELRPDADGAPEPPSEGGGGAHLSPREREVLGLVAAGQTNGQIAENLVISPHTVSRHLENIFAKLGVSTRAAATAYAYEHDLL